MAQKSSNLKGFEDLLGHEVVKRRWAWSNEFMGRWMIVAYGKSVVHIGFAIPLSNLSRMCMSPYLLFVHVNLGPEYPRSAKPLWFIKCCSPLRCNGEAKGLPPLFFFLI